MHHDQPHTAAFNGNERLKQRAARAQETDLRAQEAEFEVARLRKEMKRARKAYRGARQASKAAVKAAEKARAELSECLDEAFRDLAMALQGGAEAKPEPNPADQQPSDDREGRAEGEPQTAKENRRDPVAASG